MALFDYRCESCKQEFEVLVGVVKADPFDTCPDCGSKEVRKLVTMPAERVYTQFMDEGERKLHMLHKLDIEHAAKNGKLQDLKGKNKHGSEFEPNLPKTIY